MQVVIADGVPVKWLFTSKNGDVMRKRVIDGKKVHERFDKISLANARNVEQRACVVRYIGGRSAVLDSAAFASFMTSFPPSDHSILAVQVMPQLINFRHLCDNFVLSLAFCPKQERKWSSL